MAFRMGRTSIRLMLDEDRCDHVYYRERGWFESDYYYPTRLGPFARVVGAGFDWFAARSSRRAMGDARPSSKRRHDGPPSGSATSVSCGLPSNPASRSSSASAPRSSGGSGFSGGGGSSGGGFGGGRHRVGRRRGTDPHLEPRDRGQDTKQFFCLSAGA